MRIFPMNNTPREIFIKIHTTMKFFSYFFFLIQSVEEEGNQIIKTLISISYLKIWLRGEPTLFFSSQLYAFLSCSPFLSFSEVSYFLLTSQNISVQSSAVSLREDFASEQQFIPPHFIKGVSHTLQTMSHCAIAAVTLRPDLLFFYCISKKHCFFGPCAIYWYDLNISRTSYLLLRSLERGPFLINVPPSLSPPHTLLNLPTIRTDIGGNFC